MRFQLTFKMGNLPELKFFNTRREAELYAADLVETYDAEITSILDLSKLVFCG